MRKQSLRQTANLYLVNDSKGSPRDKQYRRFVIDRVIEDLFVLGNAPSKDGFNIDLIAISINFSDRLWQQTEIVWILCTINFG
ncbi:hypothetical protein BN59_00049 [Legionella massiliensis]|uniref:Uncharacterized protein n=1 Tax=Legionella massiliensis TaxID=1034943 RepID=A0A078KRS5_9GAMM|nr:hypothetical protein [Legionella massiliensis]CDZ75791.1 hypothetical protein BN59_00049 [Legionella massiliensis]CEE11529.1 hypothetical protein BN1094_00049 [Legionella massiliensis]